MHQQAFRLAASELGMASAARLFVREAARVHAADGVQALREQLGRDWPVLDAVCAGWLQDVPAQQVDVASVLPSLQGATRLVLVGYEADWVDALLPALPAEMRVGLVQVGDPLTQWPRVLANHGGRVQALALANFQSWAGPRSVLLTFVYSVSAGQVFVLPSWLRVAGADVRLQFRSLVGWRIQRLPMTLYPRWLVAADAQTLTALCPQS